MTNMFGDFFNSAVFYLKICGCWFDERESPRSRRFRASYGMFCFIVAYIFHTPLSILAAIYISDMDSMIEYLKNITGMLVSFFQFVCFYLARRKGLKTINTLTKLGIYYEEYGDFSPNKIVLKYKKQVEFWRKIFTYSLYGILLAFFVTTMYNFVFRGEEQYIFENGTMVYRQAFPMDLVNPFGRKTREQFMMGFIAMFCGVIIESLVFGGKKPVFQLIEIFHSTILAINIWFASLMCCTVAHVDIIAGAFRTLRHRCETRLNGQSSKLSQDMEQEQMKCIKHLQILQKVFRYLDEIFSLQMFLYALGFLLLMGTCLFKLTVKGISGGELSFIASSGAQFFVCCWFGNLLTEANYNLRKTLYLSEWESASPTFKKNMIITMMRLSKPACITIGTFIPLTLELFVSVAKTAYSMFTMLQQLKKETIEN